MAHQDKPDFVAEDQVSNEILGIEIMHLFYDEGEALMLLGRTNNQIHNIMDFSNLIQTLNNKLHKKIAVARNYNFKHKMFLIIRVVSPIFDISDFNIHEEDILIPQNTFDQIWLLFYNVSTQSWDNLKRLEWACW